MAERIRLTGTQRATATGELQLFEEKKALLRTRTLKSTRYDLSIRIIPGRESPPLFSGGSTPAKAAIEESEALSE